MYNTLSNTHLQMYRVMCEWFTKYVHLGHLPFFFDNAVIQKPAFSNCNVYSFVEYFQVIEIFYTILKERPVKIKTPVFQTTNPFFLI